MPRETVINPPVRGAQRTECSIFPSPQLEVLTNPIGLNWLDRQGFNFQDRGTNTGIGAPPAGSGYALYRGRIAYKQTGGVGSGGFYTGGEPGIFFPQNASGIGGDYQDDTRCWRVVAILAYDNVNLASSDKGLEVGAGMAYDVISGTSPGIVLMPVTGSTVNFRVRQSGGGAITIDTVVASGIDVADWHTYELRFIGATSRTDAVVKALFDGVQVASASWGAGTLLPNWGNGANLGYQYAIGNRGAQASYIPKMGLQVSSAATEQGLL